jgi:hypothetical protein
MLKHSIILIFFTIFFFQTGISQFNTYTWNGNAFGAAGEQAKRYRIGRVYFNSVHWGAYGDIKFSIHCNYFKSATLEYIVLNNASIGVNEPKLICTSSSGAISNFGRIELGQTVSAGSEYEGGTNSYKDIFFDASYYTLWSIKAETSGQLVLDQSTISSTNYGLFTLFTTPTSISIDNFYSENKTVSIPTQNSNFSIGTKTGIGVNVPITQLHVNGSITGGEAASTTSNPNGIIQLSTEGTGVITNFGINANVTPQYFWIQPRYLNQANFYNTALNPNGGNVGIGTTTPTEKLSVNGNIKAKKLIVSQAGWPDYVFSKNYKLKPLSEVDQFIKTNKHLPDMPSAKDVKNKGLDVGNAQSLLVRKIEELTLYIIKQDKKVEEMQNQINQLKKVRR